MPFVTISAHTAELIRSQTRDGFRFRNTTVRGTDGRLLLPVDDEVLDTIRQHQYPGETDDDTISRLVRTAIGLRPD